MPDYHGRELYGETVRTELHGFVRSERGFRAFMSCASRFSGTRNGEENHLQAVRFVLYYTSDFSHGAPLRGSGGKPRTGTFTGPGLRSRRK